MAKDLYHDAVTTALKKDGWTIVDENVRLRIDRELSYYIDVLAEKYVIAKRKNNGSL